MFVIDSGLMKVHVPSPHTPSPNSNVARRADRCGFLWPLGSVAYKVPSACGFPVCPLSCVLHVSGTGFARQGLPAQPPRPLTPGVNGRITAGGREVGRREWVLQGETPMPNKRTFLSARGVQRYWTQGILRHPSTTGGSSSCKRKGGVPSPLRSSWRRSSHCVGFASDVVGQRRARSSGAQLRLCIQLAPLRCRHSSTTPAGICHRWTICGSPKQMPRNDEDAQVGAVGRFGRSGAALFDSTSVSHVSFAYPQICCAHRLRLFFF